jgi:DNA-binding NarL/FixJ family response regulator
VFVPSPALASDGTLTIARSAGLSNMDPSRFSTVERFAPGAATGTEIPELAIEGRTNRGISEALFVTQKTVELHLSNAYRKLGVAGRRDLEAALAA